MQNTVALILKIKVFK